MNGKLIVIVSIVAVIGYTFSQMPEPTPNVLAKDYATTVAAVATVAAYESLSPPKEVAVRDIEDAHEVQMQAIDPVEPAMLQVSYVNEAEVVPANDGVQVDNEGDVKVPEAWKYLNAIRVQSGAEPLTFSQELSDGCRAWSAKVRKNGSLYRYIGVRKHVAYHDSGDFRECIAQVNIDDPKQPINQWLKSKAGHKEILLSRSATEGGLAYDGCFWVFRTRSVSKPTKTVTITTDSGVAGDADVKVHERTVGNACTGNTCTTSYATDGQRTVKTYNRTGKQRPVRYALWKLSN